MSEKRYVLVEVTYTPALHSATTAAEIAASIPFSLEGFTVDQSYKPVKIPQIAYQDESNLTVTAYDSRPEACTYVIRGEVADQSTLDRLLEIVSQHPEAIQVFVDPTVRPKAGSPGYVCPPGFDQGIGTHHDVANLLDVAQLRAKQMDGSNVRVAIVDTGINLKYLQQQGLNPHLDVENSWICPTHKIEPGQAPTTGFLGHGTMCAFDACIAAPNCTLLDYSIFSEQGPATQPGSFQFYLGLALQAYAELLRVLEDQSGALVISNSWALFNPAIEDPETSPEGLGNYSNNPNHPFNRLVAVLAAAGADILFASGDCGFECPGKPCQPDVAKAAGTIYGANSSPAVLSIGAVTTQKVRLGYSGQGPGRLAQQKPDLCAYAHFCGSGIVIDLTGFHSNADVGTSAACPVAAGVVAAIRTVYPPSRLSPAQLRQVLRSTALHPQTESDQAKFDYDYGYGIINVSGILSQLEKEPN